MDARQQRGLVIAKDKRIRNIADGKWLVPSQTQGAGGYVVDVKAATCSCPDHETRGGRCKHLYAIEFVMRETTRETVERDDGTMAIRETTREVRVRYTQDWPAYNAAQTTEKETVGTLLRALCDGIVPPKQSRGRPRLALADVTHAAVMKVYVGMSGRRAFVSLVSPVSALTNYSSGRFRHRGRARTAGIGRRVDQRVVFGRNHPPGPSTSGGRSRRGSDACSAACVLPLGGGSGWSPSIDCCSSVRSTICVQISVDLGCIDRLLQLGEVANGRPLGLNFVHLLQDLERGFADALYAISLDNLQVGIVPDTGGPLGDTFRGVNTENGLLTRPLARVSVVARSRKRLHRVRSAGIRSH